MSKIKLKAPSIPYKPIKNGDGVKPFIVKKIAQEAYERGINEQHKCMLEQIAYKLETLDEVPGVGSTMQKRIIKHFQNKQMPREEIQR